MKRKTFKLFLLAVAVCILLFYFSNLFPSTFSTEIPVIEIPDTPDTYEEENPPGENPPEDIKPEPSPSPAEDPLPGSTIPEGGGLTEWDQATTIEQLRFLQSPIPGAMVTTRDSQLPGAPRAYRNGTHEGLDYYDGACGVSIRFGDPVYAAGDGVIYRIDKEYTEFREEERDELLRMCGELADTPADILDKLRGRQVWVRHPNGVITVYAHLSRVAELQKGEPVKAGDFLGEIGNSGTSDGAKGTTEGSHLHFEIWIGDQYFGDGLPPKEVRKLLKEILE